jgi:DNA-directed RNA polymerase subunit H (RpoH/RPB5)
MSKHGNPLLKAGIPMVLLVVGGSFFLSNFTQTSVQMKDRYKKSRSERQFNLEEEHDKLLKKLDIDNFTLSKIPRPDEDTKTVTREKGKTYSGKKASD